MESWLGAGMVRFGRGVNVCRSYFFGGEMLSDVIIGGCAVRRRLVDVRQKGVTALVA